MIHILGICMQLQSKIYVHQDTADIVWWNRRTQSRKQYGKNNQGVIEMLHEV